MKRLIICADGTWNSPASAYPTNVLRVARGILPGDNQGRQQIVFYDWGVGSDRKKLGGGLSGAGIDKNIMDCYRFIVHNYEDGDELYLFGFSRGAYTVRSLGGLIRNCGVLRRDHADRISAAYKLYRRRNDKSHPSKAEARAFRKKHAVADTSPIEFVGVWDTVGALGIPVMFWGLLEDEKFLFHDTEPSKIIRHARHALSLDENREDFLPTMWDAKPGMDLKQVWFAGVHADVGGGYQQRGLSDVALAWMLDEAQQVGLAVEDHLLTSINSDPLDKQHNEYKGLYRLRGRVVRELPENPSIHRSVKRRWEDPKLRYKSRTIRRHLGSTKVDWSMIDLVR